jgi:hypothetical protein
VNIAQDFSRYPAGRYKADGPFAGEVCRQRLLVPALRRQERVIVELDGTRGYGSSFLEELFGGLVREEGFDVSALKDRLQLKSENPILIQEIWEYILDAEKKMRRDDA